MPLDPLGKAAFLVLLMALSATAPTGTSEFIELFDDSSECHFLRIFVFQQLVLSMAHFQFAPQWRIHSYQQVRFILVTVISSSMESIYQSIVMEYPHVILHHGWTQVLFCLFVF